MTQTGEKHDVLQLGKSPTTSPSACDVGDGVGLAIGGRVVAPGNAKSIRRATQSGSRASPSATSKTGADQVHRAQYCRDAGHRHRTQTLVLRSVSAARRQRTEGGGRIDAKAPASRGVLWTRKSFTHPLAECRLIVTGTDVQVASSPEKIMSALRAPGQTSFAFIFDIARTVEEMKQEIKASEGKPPGRASTAQPARVRSARRAIVSFR